MKTEQNITELAVAAWRLERWLDNLNAERKMAAKKSLREIKNYLEASDIEIVDPLGWRFDPGLAVEIVNNEASDADDDKLIVVQTNTPIIKQNGSVVQHGKVILGLAVKEPKPNNEIASEAQPASKPTPNLNGDPAGGNADKLLYKRFDLRAVPEGYQAELLAVSSEDTVIELMDEQVFKAFCQGRMPLNRFIYTQTAASAYITPPYPDVWYVLAHPLKGYSGSEYRLYINCNWIPKAEQSKGSDVPTENKLAALPKKKSKPAKEPLSQLHKKKKNSTHKKHKKHKKNNKHQ